MSTPFVYLADLEEQAESFAQWGGFELWWSGQEFPDQEFCDLQANVVGGLANTDQAICREKGHDFVDYGVAGPDTGSIDLYCRRCNYSHSVVLY